MTIARIPISCVVVRVWLGVVLVGASTALPPVTADADTLAATSANVEGPYYKPGSPKRTSLLEQGVPGTRMMLSGRVLTTAGAPIKDAWLDFWQSDARGKYDNEAYRFRGHQFTDAAGRYTLETVVPGSYFGRTAHIHVKVSAPGYAPLTTQLFFPDQPQNTSDSLFRSGLVVRIRDTADGKQANFDFVLETVRRR